MIEYNYDDLLNIFNKLLEKFVACKNDLEARKFMYKEIKEVLDLIYKLETEEIKKVKRRGWTIKRIE